MSLHRSATGRLPSLDGLRAVSITFVLLSHLAGTKSFISRTAAPWFTIHGQFGVRVFFVISGFIITKLLLDERDRFGRISLQRFYIRRMCRLFPAIFLYLGIVFVLAQTSFLQLRPGDITHAITYTANYHYDRSWYVGHIWSLSVEEQFYLLWPIALATLCRRWAMTAAAGVLLIAPVVRLGTWLWLPGARVGIGESFQTVADALAAGCLLAGLRDRIVQRPWYRSFLKSPWISLVPCMMIALETQIHHPVFHYGFGVSAMNILIAIYIDYCMCFPNGAVGKVLNCRPFVYVGLLSYSLYIWQQLFLNRGSGWVVAAFPYNLILAITCAVFSYHGIEKRFLRLGRSFAPQSAPEPVRAGVARTTARATVAGQSL